MQGWGPGPVSSPAAKAATHRGPRTEPSSFTRPAVRFERRLKNAYGAAIGEPIKAAPSRDRIRERCRLRASRSLPLLARRRSTNFLWAAPDITPSWFPWKPGEAAISIAMSPDHSPYSRRWKTTPSAASIVPANASRAPRLDKSTSIRRPPSPINLTVTPTIWKRTSHASSR